MWHIADEFAQILLTLGLPGLIIAVLLYACLMLFRLYSQVQEKRIVESAASVTALQSSTIALNRLTDLLVQQVKK